MLEKIKIIRATTVPQSLNVFCKGMLRELSEKYEVIGIASPGEGLNEVADREGVRVIAVPMERHISIMKDLKSLFQMMRVFRKERPAMVHSMTPKAGLICMISAWLTRVPVRIHTFTGLVFPTSKGLKRKILMITDRLTCACATHIIPEGEGVKNDLLNNGITKKPLRVLGFGNVRGVDMDYYSRRKEVLDVMREFKLRDESVFTFLFVGRIVKDKGVNELVYAFDKLFEVNKGIRLYMVGPDEEGLDPISTQSREIIKSNPSIKLVGRKTGEELLAYYTASDCFVMPSYREGFPNTVLEAGALGLPSIVTDINGSREIIKEGENGLIVPPRDANSLFHAMQTILNENTDRNRMAINARQMIEDRFEQKYVRNCLYEFYDEVLAKYK